MEPFNIFTSYISWDSGGKVRPVLVYALDDDSVKIYPITTQYENKSESVKLRYFKINDWSQAGLDKQSYIDTGTSMKQSLSVFANLKRAGTLTESDKTKLLEFLSVNEN